MTTEPNDLGPLLSVSAIIRRYHGAIARRTFLDWRQRGRGPAWVRIEGRIFYPLAAVLEWEETVRQQKRATPPRETNEA